jgi:hypothetical protein
MAAQNLYLLVKQLLTEQPELRDSDKKLIWKVWKKLGLLSYWSAGEQIDYGDFLTAPSTETIRRCRQSIQEHCPGLRSSKKVQEAKDRKEATKSTFIYREPVQGALA